jgi:hypothetical protein
MARGIEVPERISKPYGPVPQELLPRIRYQKTSPVSGLSPSDVDEAVRPSPRHRSPSPVPSGNARTIPRATSDDVLFGAGFQVIVELPPDFASLTPVSTSPGSGVPVPEQTPLWHVSFVVQALPSSHALPSDRTGLEHRPVCELHDPAEWHESIATQTTCVPEVHTPDWHELVWLQRFPWSHHVPSGIVGLEQTPVVGSQVPTSWQTSLAEQVTEFEPVQIPL